jgi:hypothetical protein
MSRVARITALCLIALVVAASPALASFRISGGLGYQSNPNGNRDSFFANRDVPVGDGVTISGTEFDEGLGNRAFLAQTSAYAGAGYLESPSNARYNQDYRWPGSGSLHIIYGGSNFAEFTLDDVVIAGPAGPITTAINFHLSGEQVTTAINNPSIGETSARGASTVQLYANVNDVTVGSGFKTYQSDHLGSGVNGSSGWLTNWTLDGVLTSDPFTVNANEPFTILVQLHTSAYAYAYTGHFGGAEGASDFSHTASFATDRPVFDLPGGYTASSASANVVDNTFVPEPGAAALSAGALLGLLSLFRGRTRSRRAQLATPAEPRGGARRRRRSRQVVDEAHRVGDALGVRPVGSRWSPSVGSPGPGLT